MFSFEIWSEGSSVLPKDPELKQHRLSKQVYRVYRPQSKTEIIRKVPKKVRSRYFSFTYFIHFHRLLLYRWPGLICQLLIGFLIGILLFLLLAAALIVPLYLMGLFNGKEKTKKNKIISVLFSKNDDNDHQYNSNNSDDDQRHNNNNNEYHHHYNNSD